MRCIQVPERVVDHTGGCSRARVGQCLFSSACAMCSYSRGSLLSLSVLDALQNTLTMLVSLVPLPGAVRNFPEAALAQRRLRTSFRCHGYYWPCVLNSLRGGSFCWHGKKRTPEKLFNGKKIYLGSQFWNFSPWLTGSCSGICLEFQPMIGWFLFSRVARRSHRSREGMTEKNCLPQQPERKGGEREREE